MQKLCCVRTRQHSLPVWIISSQVHHCISTNSQSFLVGIVSYMFGDNRPVVTGATIPHSTLGKRHNILAFHRVREAIAAKIMDFHWIQSEYNLSDMLRRHWEHNKIYPMIQKLLITCGPITLIPRSVTEEISKLPNKYTHTTHKTS